MLTNGATNINLNIDQNNKHQNTGIILFQISYRTLWEKIVQSVISD